MIPEHTLEQVAAASDIVDVISGYFPLKRTGATYKACCPFHQERTPSFNVNPARQIFKCFGCGAGGGVFKFVQLYENLSFPEAVKRLAEKAGIHIEEEAPSPEEDSRRRMRQRLLSLHADAAEWFHTNLLRTKAGKEARDYLKSREISSEVAKAWKIGYAPDSWDALIQMARAKGYREDELAASGLVTRTERDEGTSRFYDRFRDRLMFPICDKLGEVIAFSGRVLRADAFGGKYVNSPETPIFTKSKVLFGLHKAMRAMIEKSSVIVCEGQLDLIRVFEAGFQNVTASQGTAFTEAQAHILRRYADEAVLCFDADNAGLNAAEKSLPHLLGAGMSIRVATMPPGHDPDSLIRTGGAEAFAARIAAAQDFFEFQIERHASTPEFSSAKGKVAFAKKMAASVALIGDPLLREAVINNVSTRLEMPAAQFLALLKQEARNASRRTEREREPDAEPPPQRLVLGNTARLLCQLCLLDAAVRDWLLAQPWRELFEPLPEAELLGRVLNGHFTPGDFTSISAFMATLEPETQTALTELLDVRQLPPEPLKVAADCLRDLERRELQRQRDAYRARLRKPGLDPATAAKLQVMVQELQKRLNELRG